MTETENRNVDSKVNELDGKIKSKQTEEFVSDTFQTLDQDLEEVKAGMKKLGIDVLATQDTQAHVRNGKTYS